MLLVSNSILLAVIAFLTVNSVLSILKLVVRVGYPSAQQLLRGGKKHPLSDFETIFASAEIFTEIFNAGLLDRRKWRMILQSRKRSVFAIS